MEWKEVRLGDIADIQTGPFGSQLHNKDYVTNGTPIVTVEHLGNKKFTTQNLPQVSNNDKKRLNKYISKCGDIIFSRVGSVDRCSLVDSESDGWLFSGRCLRVRPITEIDSEFLYYFFCKEQTKEYIRRVAVGATMPSINTKILGDIPIYYPKSINDQRRIAAILSSLDRKIELNNKINAQLEEMAQTLFKHWFVDFGPFKNGKFIESELGLIPEGWKVGTIKDLADIKYGKDHKKLADGSIPVYGSGGLMRKAEKELYHGESVLIPRKGTLNNVMYVNESFWTVDTMFYSTPKIKHVMKYLYIFLSNKDLSSMNAGSAVPSMTTDILNKMDVVIPDFSVLEQFDEILDSLFIKLAHSKKESEQLSSLRDTLLPKLMSGEISLSEYDR